MARLVFGMNQSLDGYVDHMKFAPSPALFRHFVAEAQGQAGSGAQKGRMRKARPPDGSGEHGAPALRKPLVEAGGML